LLLKEIVALAVALAFLVKNQTFPPQNAGTTYPPQELQKRNHKPPRTYKDILADIQREFNTILHTILPNVVYIDQATEPLRKQVLIKNLVVTTANEKFQEFFPSRRLEQDIQSFLPSSTRATTQQHTSAG
jgi:hypothetical protein